MFKNKINAVLLIIIIILICLIFLQRYNYKNTVGGYDILALGILENYIEELVYYADEKQLTDKMFLHYKERIRSMASIISRSPNTKFMGHEMYNFIDAMDKREFVDKELDKCRKLQRNLEIILRDNHNGIRIYNYFNDQSNRDKFLEILE